MKGGGQEEEISGAAILQIGIAKENETGEGGADRHGGGRRGQKS